jgi:nucleotide-binding universal stress UspA family protein
MKRAIQLITDSAAPGARSKEADLFNDQERAILFKRNLHVARRILVPIDLTQQSLTTIRQSIRLAQHFCARLTLLHVYQPPISFETPGQPDLKGDLLKDRRQAEEALKEQGTSVRAAYPNCEWIFRSGDPGKCVLDLALELRADLIVISSHHAFWCDRFRQNNNNAAYILSHAPCPVLEVTDNGDSFLNGAAIPEVPGTLSSK